MRTRTAVRAVGRVLLATGAIYALLVAVTLSADEDLGVEERETIERTFPAPKSIDIDNVDGSITLTKIDAGETQCASHW